MPLGELQTALGLLVIARSSDARTRADALRAVGGLSLTTAERDWLDRLFGSEGFRVTCKIQRWWRRERLQRLTRATLSVLRRHKALGLLGEYLETHPCESMFTTPEALGFLDFVIGAAPPLPHLDCVARCERAVVLAVEAAASPSEWRRARAEILPTDTVRTSPFASLITLHALEGELLETLKLVNPTLAPAAGVPALLFAPALPHFCRRAAPDESQLFRACCEPAEARCQLAKAGCPKQTLYSLANVGALCVN